MSTELIRRAFRAVVEEFLPKVRKAWPKRPRMAAVGSCCLLGAISVDTLCVDSLGGYRAVVGRRVVGGVVAVAERLSAEHNTASEKLRTELVALHPDDGQSMVHTRGAWRVNGIIQNVAASIMPFSKKRPRSVCVLFANGTISNVALNQPGSSGSNFTYEGRFEILQLSASFTAAEEDGRRISGRFCFSLAGPNGCVIGGVVAGMPRAASPIQFSLLRKRQKLPISKELKVAQPITAAKELASTIEKRVLSLGKAAYQELTGVKRLKLDEQGVLHWPVLLLYPEVMSSDFIEDFPETDFLSPHLHVMFSESSPPLPWDENHTYTRDTIELYYQVYVRAFCLRVNNYLLTPIDVQKKNLRPLDRPL